MILASYDTELHYTKSIIMRLTRYFEIFGEMEYKDFE